MILLTKIQSVLSTHFDLKSKIDASKTKLLRPYKLYWCLKDKTASTIQALKMERTDQIFFVTCCHQQELAPVPVAIYCSQCSWSTWHKQVHVCAQTHTHTQMCELIILHAFNFLFLSSLHHSILLPILYPFHQNSNFSHFTGWKDETQVVMEHDCFRHCSAPSYSYRHVVRLQRLTVQTIHQLSLCKWLNIMKINFNYHKYPYDVFVLLRAE